MDSFQHLHNYMRPPPPPPPPPHAAVDPHPHHFHQMPPPSQPAPPQAPWYSTQFQYHPSQTPSPPPQWPPPPPPPPHTDHFPPAASYPPPSNPYPYHPNQFPQPRSHVPSQFPVYSHIPQPYPQEWNNPSWHPNQGYSADKNEEDWAAKARAWADAKAAMESQHPQSQFSAAGRLQEQSHYHDQFQPSADSRYPDFQNQSYQSSSNQQFSFLDASMQRLSGHSQEAAPVSMETSFTSDGHAYSTRDVASIGDPTAAFEQQGGLPTNPSVHQQEVPSSYSSVTGAEAADQIQQSYSSLPLSRTSSQEQNHLQPSMQALFASGSHSMDPAISLADQPLDFEPRFNRDNDLQMQSTYSHHDSAASVRGIDPVSGVSSMNNWAAPMAPGIGYLPIPPILASGPQHDSSITTPSPVPGHMAPPFGRFPGPGLPPTISPTVAAFSLSGGTAIHPTAAFSADTYGVSGGVPERPKKASVPNWLREEIKKTVISAPSIEHVKEETFMEDGIDKSYVKFDDQDSKSIDSSRSAEEEEEDQEDQVEAARIAAINQEIKRVLTEVLLKVTDELFDEIASKVLREDDQPVEVGHNVAASNDKASASPPSAPLPKASAKILVPLKAKEVESDVVNEKSNSSSPGDVLGLGNYGSDADEGDDEIESSSLPTPVKDAAPQLGIKKLLVDLHGVPVNSSSHFEEHARSQTLVNHLAKTSSLQFNPSNGGAIDQLHDEKVTKELAHSHPSKVLPEDRDEEPDVFQRRHDSFNGEEKSKDYHLGRESRSRSEKADQHDRNFSEKDFVKEVQSSKTRTDEKDNENLRRKDERHQKKEKTDYTNEAKERTKEHNLKHGEKAKESESRRKSSRVDVKDDRKEVEKTHRGSTIEDTSWEKEHSKDKGEHKSRKKDSSNPDRHKRRSSPSASSRGRTSKDRAVNRGGDSSEGSDGSKRKLHSRKHDLSPSPVRSRRRGRRSRSRSPVRRHR